MKPDTFDFKSLPAFLLKLYPLYHLIISPHMLLNWKTKKTVSLWRSSWRWNKAEWNITFELSVWFIQLSTYFYQTVRFTTNLSFQQTNIYIYIYIDTHTHTHTHTHTIMNVLVSDKLWFLFFFFIQQSTNKQKLRVCIYFRKKNIKGSEGEGDLEPVNLRK